MWLFMFASDFARRHWNFILVTSASHTYFSYGLLTRTNFILYYCTTMKNEHSLELMSGERRGYTTAPNRSTAIRTRLSIDRKGDV